MRTASLHLLALALLAAPSASWAQDAAGVFEKVKHAIFMVIVTTDDSSVVDVVSQGSAVLIAPGRLVTNCHVVEKGSAIIISRREDKITERARIVGKDAQADLCELDLLQMKPAFEKPVEIAPKDSLRVGEPVYAIGSPRGMELTISDGIVSAAREARGNVRVIQTTAPFSPGSSGGGLFDVQGRLVGITTLIVKDSQNLNFAVSSQYIPSAGISAAELARQRKANNSAVDAYPVQEGAYERAERMRRAEQQAIETRKKQLDAQLRGPSASNPTASVTPPVRHRTAKEMAVLLAPYEGPRDLRPARTYDRLHKNGELTGLDDDDIVRKVYGTLMREQVNENLRWSGGGSHVAEFQVQLRRNGEIMFVIPGKSSSLDSFDREAQRAIGAASPFMVPQDNAAFELVRTVTIEVRGPKK
ncbi:MAG TPA: trypsin-like peptidase domain-containing protein [Burkholderiales bacterium]